VSPVLWQAGWVAVFAWLTYTTGRSVLTAPPPIQGRLRKIHDHALRPFGAALTFVLASFTLLAAWGLVQLLLR
jgi:hypothetical protein